VMQSSGELTSQALSAAGLTMYPMCRPFISGHGLNGLTSQVQPGRRAPQTSSDNRPIWSIRSQRRGKRWQLSQHTSISKGAGEVVTTSARLSALVALKAGIRKRDGLPPVASLARSDGIQVEVRRVWRQVTFNLLHQVGLGFSAVWGESGWSPRRDPQSPERAGCAPTMWKRIGVRGARLGAPSLGRQ
jgi:hypothetical protein